MDLAKEETYAGHWARSQKSPQIKTPQHWHFHPGKKLLADALTEREGSGVAKHRLKTKQNKKTNRNNLTDSRFHAQRSHAGPARRLGVSGARSPAGGEGRGGWALGTPNQQPAPAVVPVTSEALPPPHCGRTPGAASHPSSRLRRGGVLGAGRGEGGTVRVRSRSPGGGGAEGGHAHARSRGGRGRRGRLLECRRP